jgi:hypothetical protein
MTIATDRIRPSTREHKLGFHFLLRETNIFLAARDGRERARDGCGWHRRLRELPPSRNYLQNPQALGGSLLLTNGVKRSIGTGRNVVVLCSLEISRMVCRKRSCSAIGSLLIIAAAWTIFSAA